jgi:hypothetical protein
MVGTVAPKVMMLMCDDRPCEKHKGDKIQMKQNKTKQKGGKDDCRPRRQGSSFVQGGQ